MTQALLNQFFKGPRSEALLEPVELVPWGNTPAGVIDISDSGYEWKDFEYIDVITRGVSDGRMYSPEHIPGYGIRKNPTSWTATVGYNDATNNYALGFAATSSTTANLTTNLASANLGALIGYRRRYSATNIADIVTELLTQNGYAPRTESILYDNTAVITGSLTLSANLAYYDELYFQMGWEAGGNTHRYYNTIRVEDIIDAVDTANHDVTLMFVSSGSNFATQYLTGYTSNSLTLQGGGVTYSSTGVTKVIGIKYGV